MHDHSLPVLGKYENYRHIVMLLGKYEIAADWRIILRPGDVEIACAYVEILFFELNKEIMSHYFGNNLSLSMEGASLKFLKEKA